MNNEIIPELNEDEWRETHESAAAYGLKGLTRALQLTTKGIVNTRLAVTGSVGHLTDRMDSLNDRLDSFNESSGELSNKALKLSFWVASAAVVSALATFVMALDILLKWLNP